MIKKVLTFILKESIYCIMPQGAFNFMGRATRWQFVVGFIISAGAMGLLRRYRDEFQGFIDKTFDINSTAVHAVVLIYFLIVFLSITARRAHDYNGSFLFIFLIMFIPVANVFIYFFFMLLGDTYRGPNKHGPDPYGGEKAYKEWLTYMEDSRIAASADPDYKYYTAEEKELASRMDTIRERAAQRRRNDEAAEYARRKREEEARAEAERIQRENFRRMHGN